GHSSPQLKQFILNAKIMSPTYEIVTALLVWPGSLRRVGGRGGPEMSLLGQETSARVSQLTGHLLNHGEYGTACGQEGHSSLTTHVRARFGGVKGNEAWVQFRVSRAGA